jgi:hypothetical protein
VKTTIWASLALVGAFTISACGGSTGSSSAQAVQSSAQAALSAAATNPAVVAAKKRATDTVMKPCENTLPNIGNFKTCVYDKLGITGNSDAAKTKRHTLGNCLVSAALNSRLTKTGGITRFTEGSGLECVAAQLPPEPKSSTSPRAKASTSVSPSPSTSSSSPAPVASKSSSSSAAASGIVHAGAYCSAAGTTGVTSTGHAEVCRVSATDSRLRWRSAA